MGRRPALQGAGAPSFCWHCHRQLQRAPGKALGLYYFELVVDQDNRPHRVHQDCLPEVIGDGVKRATTQEG